MMLQMFEVSTCAERIITFEVRSADMLYIMVRLTCPHDPRSSAGTLGCSCPLQSDAEYLHPCISIPTKETLVMLVNPGILL